MEHNELNSDTLKVAFSDAMRYIGDYGALISYSASIIDRKILAKIIVDQNITPSEEDDIMDILGHIVSHFPDITADFHLVKINGDKAMDHSDDLPIRLFRRAS
jgi:hypothetical protein